MGGSEGRRRVRCTRWIAAAGLTLAAAGCQPRAVIEQIGVPGLRTEATVTDVVLRDVYLDVLLDSPFWSLRYFFPASEICRRILAPQASVTYVSLGPWGEIQDARKERCVPAGIGSLQTWRNRKPRPRSSSPIPRRPANFRIVHRDEDYAFARGFFPLAGAIGWTGGVDTIGVIPNTEPCRPLIEGGTASMEFRPVGPEPFRLVSAAGTCPLAGFIQPPSNRQNPPDG